MIAVGQGFGRESAEFTAICDRAFQMGIDWANAGNAKLPRTFEIDRKVYTIPRSTGEVPAEFRRGFKSVR